MHTHAADPWSRSTSRQRRVGTSRAGSALAGVGPRGAFGMPPRDEISSSPWMRRHCSFDTAACASLHSHRGEHRRLVTGEWRSANRLCFAKDRASTLSIKQQSKTIAIQQFTVTTRRRRTRTSTYHKDTPASCLVVAGRAPFRFSCTHNTAHGSKLLVSYRYCTPMKTPCVLVVSNIKKTKSMGISHCSSKVGEFHFSAISYAGIKNP